MRCEGRGLLALWNDTEPTLNEEYNQWHATEHVPERLTVPGMLNAYRYYNPDNGRFPYFTLYEMETLETLDSASYKRLLSHPTPWSKRMRQYFKNMRRLVCVGNQGLGHPSQSAKQLIVLTVAENELSAEALAIWFQEPLEKSVKAWRIATQDQSAAALPWAKSVSTEAEKSALLLIELDDAQPLLTWIRQRLEQQGVRSATLECYEFLNQFKTKTNN